MKDGLRARDARENRGYGDDGDLLEGYWQYEEEQHSFSGSLRSACTRNGEEETQYVQGSGKK